MPSRLALVCSSTFPGSFKVIMNLERVLTPLVNVDLIPIESLISLKVKTGIKRIDLRWRKIQVDLKALSIERLFEYGNNILFTAWGPIYDVALSKLNNRGIVPSLIMCSTPGQSELSRHELRDYHSIISYLKKGKLRYWLLNKRLFSSLGSIFGQAIYFPHTIDLDQFKSITPSSLQGCNIDLFCAIRLGKNILNQVIAVKLSKSQPLLHVNFNEPNLSRIMKDINIPIIWHPWIESHEYYSLVAGMTLSLQATFTESFSYAVAERMCLGVPPITAYDIYLTADDPFLAEHLCIKALDTPREIASKIDDLLGDEKLLTDISAKCREVINRIALKNNQEAIDFILDFVK